MRDKPVVQVTDTEAAVETALPDGSAAEAYVGSDYELQDANGYDLEEPYDKTVPLQVTEKKSVTLSPPRGRCRYLWGLFVGAICCGLVWMRIPEASAPAPPAAVTQQPPALAPDLLAKVEPGPPAVPRPRTGASPFAMGRNALALSTAPELVAKLSVQDLYVIDDMVVDALANENRTDFHYVWLPYPKGLATVSLLSATTAGSKRCVTLGLTTQWHDNIVVSRDEACTSGKSWVFSRPAPKKVKPQP